MPASSTEVLLQELNTRIRSNGQGGKTTAEDLRGFLRLLIEKLEPALMQSGTLPLPAAPTGAQSDDLANTFICTLNPIFTAAAHEFTLDGGETWASPVVLPIQVGNVVLPLDKVGVRVKGTPTNLPSPILFAGGYTAVQEVQLEPVLWNTVNCIVEEISASVKVTANAGFYNARASGSRFAITAGSSLQVSVSVVPGTGTACYFGLNDNAQTDYNNQQNGYIAGIYFSEETLQATRLGALIGPVMPYVPGTTRVVVEIWDDAIHWLLDGVEFHWLIVELPTLQVYPATRFYSQGNYLQDAWIGGQAMGYR